jgi:hypothetical protein
MDRSRLRMSLLLAIFELAQLCPLLWSGSATAALGGQRGSGTAAESVPLFVFLMSAVSVGQDRVSEELFVKARRHGMVRVIVELLIPAGSAGSREQSIRDVQQRVLKQLAGVKHEVVRSFTAVPMLVVEASEPALHLLARSDYVLRVDEDGQAAPL